jgi:hypothetical protein
VDDEDDVDHRDCGCRVAGLLHSSGLTHINSSAGEDLAILSHPSPNKRKKNDIALVWPDDRDSGMDRIPVMENPAGALDLPFAKHNNPESSEAPLFAAAARKHIADKNGDRDKARRHSQEEPEATLK